MILLPIYNGWRKVLSSARRVGGGIDECFCRGDPTEPRNLNHQKIMEKISADVYKKIDNNLYNGNGDIWWKPDTVLHLLKTSINPWRVGYANSIIKRLGIDPKGKRALEVGSGGGILTEEICKMGFTTTGIDPSEESMQTATNHAKASGLDIRYEKGTGENLPYADRSFDFVFCCDVLEHVQDLPKVISEISRVLKPGGVFIYDTLNRTLISKLVAIKILAGMETLLGVHASQSPCVGNVYQTRGD